MTTEPPDETPESAVPESLTDPDALRDRDDVAFHEERDVVDEETFETVAELDDTAPVGVTNADGEVLLMRITADCRLKIPAAAVEPGDDYAETARRWVETNAGFAVAFDDIAGVWRYEVRVDGADRTATRQFVVFAASPAPGERGAGGPAEISADREAVHAAWYDTLPDEAAEVPGTHRFFD